MYLNLYLLLSSTLPFTAVSNFDICKIEQIQKCVCGLKHSSFWLDNEFLFFFFARINSFARIKFHYEIQRVRFSQQFTVLNIYSCIHQNLFHFYNLDRDGKTGNVRAKKICKQMNTTELKKKNCFANNFPQA